MWKHNADCIVVKPTHTHSAAIAGEVTVTTADEASVRCTMLPITQRTMETLTGELGITGYSVRLVTDEAVETGWTVKLKMDGEDEYREMPVRVANKHPMMNGHTHLTVEKV